MFLTSMGDLCTKMYNIICSLGQLQKFQDLSKRVSSLPDVFVRRRSMYPLPPGTVKHWDPVGVSGSASPFF